MPTIDMTNPTLDEIEADMALIIDLRLDKRSHAASVEFGYLRPDGKLEWPDADGDLPDARPSGGYLPARFPQGRELPPILLEHLRASAAYRSGTTIVQRDVAAPLAVGYTVGESATLTGEIIAIDESVEPGHVVVSVRVPA